MSHETADILDSAADKIERHGWIQGDLGDFEEGFCAVGALYDCDKKGGLRPILDATVALKKSLGIGHIASWNDAPERTQQEVLDALRGAAKAERRAADAIDGGAA